MSIILDESPDDGSPGGRELSSRLKALKAWLARRERKEAGQATGEIVRSLYPSRRAVRDARASDGPSER
jgi:hypothetical protein